MWHLRRFSRSSQALPGSADMDNDRNALYAEPQIAVADGSSQVSGLPGDTQESFRLSKDLKILTYDISYIRLYIDLK